MHQNAKFIVLSGPTAVGKSAVAMDIARQYDIPIISADSRQVFKEMSIGTSTPSTEKLQEEEHFWINHKSITDEVSAGIFVEEVKIYLDKHQHQLAIVCGGTNFYIESLLYGIDKKPTITDEAKSAVAELYKSQGLKGLQKEVKGSDPIYYNTVDRNNHRRLQRALKVIYATGKPYSSFHFDKAKRSAGFSHLSFFLHRERDLLYDRINRRVDAMIEMGLEEEAKNLYDDRHLKNLNTVGYRELFDYFSGEISRKEAIRLIKRNTRRYAKRQLSWYRRSSSRYRKRNITDRDKIHREIQLFLLQHGLD